MMEVEGKLNIKDMESSFSWQKDDDVEVLFPTFLLPNLVQGSLVSFSTSKSRSLCVCVFYQALPFCNLQEFRPKNKHHSLNIIIIWDMMQSRGEDAGRQPDSQSTRDRQDVGDCYLKVCLYFKRVTC